MELPLVARSANVSRFERYLVLLAICQTQPSSFTAERIRSITSVEEEKIKETLTALLREGVLDRDPLSGHAWDYFVTQKGLPLLLVATPLERDQAYRSGT